MSGLRRTLAVHRCPAHGFQAVLLGGDVHGHRLTPSKCCGSWGGPVAVWSFEAERLREMADEILLQAKELELGHFEPTWEARQAALRALGREE